MERSPRIARQYNVAIIARTIFGMDVSTPFGRNAHGYDDWVCATDAGRFKPKMAYAISSTAVADIRHICRFRLALFCLVFHTDCHPFPICPACFTEPNAPH